MDNKGKGRTFSPTDLSAVSVGSCMDTTMGIAADQFGIDLGKVTCSVKKEMNLKPRRVAKLTMVINFDEIPKNRGIWSYQLLIVRHIKVCPLKLNKKLNSIIYNFLIFNK